jgi:3-deoxy-7-phosphoheptulonate synthase
MIIVLKRGATGEVAQEILDKIAALGCKPLHLPGSERVVIGALGDERVLEQLHFDNHPMVEEVKRILTPYKLVSREVHPHDTAVRLGAAAVGGERFAVLAGPSVIESREQLLSTAREVKGAGASALRGGAFRPRTSPYSFQGLGLEGLQILREVAAEVGLPSVTEVIEARDVEVVVQHASCLQIAASSMQNHPLLKEVGKARRPVLLQRGPAARVEDLLLAAEVIVSEGNDQVILCERGIRTFETCTRSTLDLGAVPFLKQRSHLPVVVDPSHGTGLRDLVAPMAKAAAACGADGILVEVHCDPKHAESDGAQALFPEQLARLLRELGPIVEAVGRRLS